MSFGKNDLSDMWIAENIKAVQKTIRMYEARYFKSTNLETSYMRGVKRCYDIHKKVLKVWEEAAQQHPTKGSTPLKHEHTYNDDSGVCVACGALPK